MNNRDDCVARAMTAVDIAKIHTFGIGNSCDIELCQMMAYYGNGTSSFVSRNHELSGKVIDALKKSMDQALGNCKV